MQNMNMNMNNSNHQMSNIDHGMSRETIPNDLMAAMFADDIGSSFLEVGSSDFDDGNGGNNNNNNNNNYIPERILSGGFGGGMNNGSSRYGSSLSSSSSSSSPSMSSAFGSNSNNNHGSDQADFSTLTNKQLGKMIMMDGRGDYTQRSNNNDDNNNLSNSNHSNSNQSDVQQQDGQQHGGHYDNATTTTTTMPNEQESYDAAANGILAPWSARAASLFGDMMEQSKQNEKAKTASRKKPKDTLKRPLSTCSIFLKERRNRILTEILANSSDDEDGGDEDGDNDNDNDNEQESYDAVANGILAPWSARAASLFVDMMEQSNQDKKAKKASRKKLKNTLTRPLSAYNIFLKEERNRILTEIPATRVSDDEDGDNDNDNATDGVPSTIAISDGLGDNNDNASADVVGSESSAATKNKNAKTAVAAAADKQNPNGKATYGKISLESLAQLVGCPRQELDDESMSGYEAKPSADMDQYEIEMAVWDAKQPRKKPFSSGKKRSAFGTKKTSINKITSLKLYRRDQQYYYFYYY